MAVLPDYVTGTITLTNGSANFTGTGTLWRTARFRDGDMVLVDNLIGVIRGTGEFGNPITSNTSGVLTRPWTGTTGTRSYRMRYLPDGARVTAQTTTLIEMLGNGNIEALAGLTGVNGDIPTFTGAGTMSTTPLTTLARSLGNVTDLNNITEAGFHRFGSGAANAPVTYSGVVLHIPFSSTQSRQFAGSHGLAGVWLTRVNVGGVWSAWQNDYNAANIIGTVSQSGGVPTGAIIQRGSNANGEFVRFADGTQVCWISSMSMGTVVTAIGSVFRSEPVLWIYPAGFAGRATVAASEIGNAYFWCGANSPSSGTGTTIALFSPTSVNNERFVGAMAIGRWF